MTVWKFISRSKLSIQNEPMGKKNFTLGLFCFKAAVLRGLDPIKCVCVSRGGRWQDVCDFQTGQAEHIQDFAWISAAGSLGRHHLTFLTIAH